MGSVTPVVRACATLLVKASATVLLTAFAALSVKSRAKATPENSHCAAAAAAAANRVWRRTKPSTSVMDFYMAGWAAHSAAFRADLLADLAAAMRSA